MRDDTLKLVLAQLLDRTAGHADHRVGGVVSSRERVDPGLLVEHVDGWHGRPRRDRHLFDHVEHATLQEVGARRKDAPSTEPGRDRPTPLPQPPGLPEGAERDERENACRGPSEDAWLPPPLERHLGSDHERDQSEQVDEEHDRGEREEEEEHQARGVALGNLLVLEEVHGWASGGRPSEGPGPLHVHDDRRDHEQPSLTSRRRSWEPRAGPPLRSRRARPP